MCHSSEMIYINYANATITQSNNINAYTKAVSRWCEDGGELGILKRQDYDVGYLQIGKKYIVEAVNTGLQPKCY